MSDLREVTLDGRVRIVTGATEADLQNWVRDHLRSSRVPVVVDIRADLPYNETGKLLRRVLRAAVESLAKSRKLELNGQSGGLK